MTDELVVQEIFLSLQGESAFVGWPCVFVRLTGCNLRCVWCDTTYAFTGGQKLGLPQILARIHALAQPFKAVSGLASLPLVELTGGEPLLQAASFPLMTKLCDLGFRVLLETSGAADISAVDRRVHCIMDLKCPGSGEAERNHWENLRYLKTSDEIKLVIACREDYEWAKKVITHHQLAERCSLSFSWAEPPPSATEETRPDPKTQPRLKPPTGLTPITRRHLAEQIISDALPVRFQIQMHKVVWPAETRGV